MEWTRVRRRLAAAWIVCAALLLIGPALAPGFVLSYDLIFTPQQTLLPGSLGVGGGLPRAVPQDAVVALLQYVIPGMLLEKIVLLGIFLLTGFGMLRLLGAAGPVAAVVAATLAMLAPFVTERLVLGHWGLLLAYALCPWAIALARDVRRRGDVPSVVRLILVLACAGLTPSGSVVATALAVPLAVGPGSIAGLRQRVAITLAALVTWLPWVVPALLHPVAGASDAAAAEVFALRAEGWWGTAVTALSGGGVWNSEVVPVSRTMWWAPLTALGVAVLALVGVRGLAVVLGRATVLWWAALSVMGAGLAVLSGTDLWTWVISEVPGAGLARDAHKLVAPLVLLLAASAGLGVARLVVRIPDRSGRIAAVIAICVLPVALQPDFVWGVGGRLRPVEYPPDWQAVRTTLEESAAPGDVLVLPWSSFRRFPWNDYRTTLDPAPRWLPRPTVVATELLVATGSGVVPIAGDDPRAQAITAAIDRGDDLTEVARGLGIGWVLIESNTGTTAELPPLDYSVVWAGSELTLGRLAGPAPEPWPLPGLTIVGIVDGVILLGLMVGWAALAARRTRMWREQHRGPQTLLP